MNKTRLLSEVVKPLPRLLPHHDVGSVLRLAGDVDCITDKIVAQTMLERTPNLMFEIRQKYNRRPVPIKWSAVIQHRIWEALFSTIQENQFAIVRHPSSRPRKPRRHAFPSRPTRRRRMPVWPGSNRHWQPTHEKKSFDGDVCPIEEGYIVNRWKGQETALIRTSKIGTSIAANSPRVSAVNSAPLRGLDAMLTTSSTDFQLPAPVPTGMARYSNRKEMARGGNGVLYSAMDRVIGRTVAIKTLLPEFRDDPSFRRRLLREARVTAQLEHPGTVPVYEIGHDDELGIYYTMKRISGENFFNILRLIASGDESVEAAFPIRRRIQIIESICQTLALAHARGVIHRDVKPDNIWIGNFGEVTLLDWGSAKVWGELPPEFNRSIGNDESSSLPSRRNVIQDSLGTESVSHQDSGYQLPTLTPTKQVIGTPTYMSPEQIGNRDIDDRSDIFSAGVCLYEAMAVAEPFRGKDRDETFDNICSRQPTPPSERSPKRHIPKEADRVFSKATAKRASSRYQTIRDFTGDLRELLRTVENGIQ